MVGMEIENRSLDWNNPDGIKCAKEKTPILNTSMPFNVGTDRRLFRVAANITESMKVPVHFLNITTLSEYRKDAHTSVHTIRQGKMLTPEQQADPATFADCIHWCLPGLPDTWNEFLYTKIISRSWPPKEYTFAIILIFTFFCAEILMFPWPSLLAFLLWFFFFFGILFLFPPNFPFFYRPYCLRWQLA